MCFNVCKRNSEFVAHADTNFQILDDEFYLHDCSLSTSLPEMNLPPALISVCVCGGGGGVKPHFYITAASLVPSPFFFGRRNTREGILDIMACRSSPCTCKYNMTG